MKKWFGMTTLVCCLMLVGTTAAALTPQYGEIDISVDPEERIVFTAKTNLPDGTNVDVWLYATAPARKALFVAGPMDYPGGAIYTVVRDGKLSGYFVDAYKKGIAAGQYDVCFSVSGYQPDEVLSGNNTALKGPDVLTPEKGYRTHEKCFPFRLKRALPLHQVEDKPAQTWDELAQADALAPVLFKEFSYGMALSEIQKKIQAEFCEGDARQGFLCPKHSVSFAGGEWRQFFVIQDGVLKSVALQSSYSLPSFLNISEAVQRNGFTLARLSTPAGNIDVLEALRSIGEDKAKARVTSLQQAYTGEGTMQYEFLQKDYFEKAKAAKAAHFGDCLREAPADLRGVSVIRAKGLLTVLFLAPARNFADLRQKAEEAANEKF